MTRVVISQPMYFPWAGFMAQMALADVYIWLDDAQFSKGSFTNRIQVKLATGRKWMTVPLQGTGSFQGIMDLCAAGQGWIAGHRQMLAQSFAGYRHAATALALFDTAMSAPGTLCDTLIAGAEAQARAIGCLPPCVLRSSAMGLGGASSDRVLRLVQAVGGTHYLTGHGAYGYLDHRAMNDAGIAVSYMDYAPRPWPQAHGDFTPYVTGLDLLAATGTAAADHLCPASLDWRDFRTRKEQTT
jgi:WbqC-like protein family